MAKKKKFIQSDSKSTKNPKSQKNTKTTKSVKGELPKAKKKLVATQPSRATTKSVEQARKKELVFGKENYKWVAIGIALITLGMLLMMGGFNENPTVWDEGEIYSLRRTLLAPIVILAGLAVEIYAIFK